VVFRHLLENRGRHPWHAGWSIMVYVGGAVAGIAAGVMVAGGRRR